MQKSHSGIALLITLMFVIVISVAIGVGLKQVNTATDTLKQEKFMYQSSIILEDVLNILKNNQELKLIAESNSSEGLYMFLTQSAFIPFSISGLDITLQIKSARSKFNPASLDANTTEALKQFCNNNRINSQYIDILVDNFSGIKEDNSYTSAIFDENPNLFRDYIASSEHLKQINNFYTKEYNDNSLKNVDFDQLFYYSKDKNVSINPNYATAEVWELMLGVSKERAEYLATGGGHCDTVSDLELNSEELMKLSHFDINCKSSILFVEVHIREGKSVSEISFEYDIKHEKGSNFAYKI